MECCVGEKKNAILWMDKYDCEETLQHLREYYFEFNLIQSYFAHVVETSISEFAMLHRMNAYREKDKWRDNTGKVTRVEWSWNDDQCAIGTEMDGMIKGKRGAPFTVEQAAMRVGRAVAAPRMSCPQSRSAWRKATSSL